ncbi:hypothetical protein MLD38_025331 [Melastoma candidum]|uniref:Uncharacterized protein n=1 Tax=Melastoma candidum TaxID=119954 RepID=A0ACB9NXY2_9MYRT|nr:hypothetical protein MLD38_025331 [Melastoma candidum]
MNIDSATWLSTTGARVVNVSSLRSEFRVKVMAVFLDYSNMFRVFGCANGSSEATTLEATKHPMKCGLSDTGRIITKGAEWSDETSSCSVKAFQSYEQHYTRCQTRVCSE